MAGSGRPLAPRDPELDALLAGVALDVPPFSALVTGAGLSPEALGALGARALGAGCPAENLGVLEALGPPGAAGARAGGVSPAWNLAAGLAAGVWGSPTAAPPGALLAAAAQGDAGRVAEALGTPGLGALLRAALADRVPLFALEDLAAVAPRCEHRLGGRAPGPLALGTQALLWRLFPGLAGTPEDGLALAGVIARVQEACVAEWERRCAPLSALFRARAGPRGLLEPVTARGVAQALAADGVAVRGWGGGPLSFTGLCEAALAFRRVL